jgi:hypothetical protein
MKEDSAFGPGMMFGISGPGPKRDTKGIPSDPKREKGKEIKKTKMKTKNHIPTFNEFLLETSLRDHSNTVPVNDIGYQLIFDAIEKHLQKSMDEIEELSEVDGFQEGPIKNFSTAKEGNFVLNCGHSKGYPACRLLDELNNTTKFYM